MEWDNIAEPINKSAQIPEKWRDWLESNPAIKYPKLQKAKFIQCINEVIIPYNTIRKSVGKGNFSIYDGKCPATFDGYGCWNVTSPGTKAYIDCPEFVNGFVLRRKAFKECLSDGTWFRHPLTNKVWSNYTNCVDLSEFKMRKMIVNLYISGYVISLLAILLALFIFWKFKSLLCTRVVIHRHLFGSFVGNNLTRIIWHSLMTNPDILLQNQISCQLVHILAQYFMCCNYMWMFCEGLYLHTLITMALRNLKHILCYLCLIGWGLPVLLVSAYAAARIVHKLTAACWMEESRFNWILNVPIITSILVSIIFLCNIIRILVAKLTSYNTTERNQFSKAVKATLILLPLLGIHFIVTPIRPAPGSFWEPFYEYISIVLISFQGLFVALIFCFFNGEVIRCLKNAFKSSRCCDMTKKKYSRISLKSIDQNQKLSLNGVIPSPLNEDIRTKQIPQNSIPLI